MREAVLTSADVSRETLRKLSEFELLVRKWSPRINLVSPSDLPLLWERHIRDSAQLVDQTDDPAEWLDLGSGGGFPGIVIAIICEERQARMRMTLVESDKRKCAFLRTAARQLDIPLNIRAERIEDKKSHQATTLTARALAPLIDLVAHADRHLAPGGMALFPKGRNWKTELELAKDKWSFDHDVIQSVTEPDARILRLRNIQRI